MCDVRRALTRASSCQPRDLGFGALRIMQATSVTAQSGSRSGAPSALGRGALGPALWSRIAPDASRQTGPGSVVCRDAGVGSHLLTREENEDLTSVQWETIEGVSVTRRKTAAEKAGVHGGRKDLGSLGRGGCQEPPA